MAQPLAQALACLLQVSGETPGQVTHQGLERHAYGQNDAEVSERGVGDEPFANLQGDEGQHLRGWKRRRPAKFSPPGTGPAASPVNAEYEHEGHAQEGDEGDGVQS